MKSKRFSPIRRLIFFIIASIFISSPIGFVNSEPNPTFSLQENLITPTQFKTLPEIQDENHAELESTPTLELSQEPPGKFEEVTSLPVNDREEPKKTPTSINSAQVCATNQQRPCFEELRSHYLSGMYSSRVFKEIGGVVALNYEPGRSACALNLSRALNYAGYEIPFEEGQTGSGADGMWYFYRVLDMGAYLVKEFGPPDYTLYLPEGMKTLEGKRGIVYFRYCQFRHVDAYGHVDLFDGKSCTRRCPGSCYDVQFWEMP